MINKSHLEKPVSAGVGEITGPASSTDSNLTEFNGTTGKIIKDGGLGHADVVSAINLKHAQNTDTGTSGNDFSIGDGADTDKTITANNGDASEPKIKYNAVSNAWQYTNNGVDWVDIGSGGGGVHYIPLATSGDYTIPTGKSFIGGDEFTVEGVDTLSIVGTGRMILVG